jgi:hypothetical protein
MVNPRSARAASSSLLLMPIRFDSSCTRGLAGSSDSADSRVGVTETVPLRGPRARTGRVRTGTSYISVPAASLWPREVCGLSGRSVPRLPFVRARCVTHRGQQRAAAPTMPGFAAAGRGVDPVSSIPHRPPVVGRRDAARASRTRQRAAQRAGWRQTVGWWISAATAGPAAAT